MFNFFNYNKHYLKEILNGLTDCHAHVLPEVDDGSRSMEESIEMLHHLEELGVKRMILTPHISEKYNKNNFSSLFKQLNCVKKLYNGKILLNLGAEYMLDDHFNEILRAEKLIEIYDKHVLVEIPLNSTPMLHTNNLYEILDKGYYVVLAHPERYLYCDDAIYKHLKSKGIKLQLNLFSLNGKYGRRVERVARHFLENDFYDLMGSDIHRVEEDFKNIDKLTLKKDDFKNLMQLKYKMDYEGL